MTDRLDGSIARVVAVVLLAVTSIGAGPVTVSTTNPHYFARDGRLLILVTSDHHYGAVIDRDFDFARYLDALTASGMNLTRIYPGAMFEKPDKYIAGNPLGPLPGRQILPWARSATAGANPALAAPGQTSMKFDLDRWNPEYFARLKAFVALADRKGIVVEVALFNGMYADSWPLMPMYHGNNVQGVGGYEAAECGLFTTDDPRNQDVMRYQRAYVAKIATELNEFDNVIFDISDEPLLQGNPDGGMTTLAESAVVPWLEAMRDAFLGADGALPKKHLLGQTVQSLSPDLSAETWCEWLPTEYVRPAQAALEKDYAARKPIVDVESDYYGFGLVKPYTPDDVRVEGWWFLLGGGAGVINLNGEYHRGQESGGADTRELILPQRRVLKDFMSGLDLASMVRFDGVKDVPPGAITSALARAGEQYAVYLAHATGDGQWGAHFVATPGSFKDTLALQAVPPGRYLLEWIDPRTGTVIASDTVVGVGRDLAVQTPAYTIDVALRLRRLGGRMP
jgi:hypothetical protein